MNHYTLALFSLVLFSPTVVFAQWVGPTLAPTGGNTSAPLNVSSSAQTKSGGLLINTGGATNGLIVQFGNVGVSTTTPWATLSVTNTSAGPSFVVEDSASPDATPFIVDTSGNVGVGVVIPGYKLDVNGDIRAQNAWLRTTGSTGWYSDTYGGGWHMSDSTWIRSYGSKPVYMSNGLDTGTASGIGCSGGLGGSYMLQVCGAAGVGAAAFYYTSDRSLKENIMPLSGSLDKIIKLQGVSFDWKEGGKRNIGVIAQDVERIYPELVKTNEKGLKSVEYGNLVAPLIEAIKEQQIQIDTLKKEVKMLKESRWVHPERNVEI